MDVLSYSTGDSSYLDFSCPQTRSWYARCYSLDKYKVSLFTLIILRTLIIQLNLTISVNHSLHVCLLGVYRIFVCVERYERALSFLWSRADHAEGHSTSWGLGAQRPTQSLWILPGKRWFHYIEKQTDDMEVTAPVLCHLSAHGHSGRTDNPLWWNREALCSNTLVLRWISEAR